jgi:hypothetical protein
MWWDNNILDVHIVWLKYYLFQQKKSSEGAKGTGWHDKILARPKNMETLFRLINNKDIQ